MGNFGGKELGDEDGEYGGSNFKGNGRGDGSFPLTFEGGSPTFTTQIHHASNNTLASKPSSKDVLAEAQVDLVEDVFDDKSVPMVFRWDGGGHQVYIAGTFNKWSEKIPMHRSGNDFTYIHELQKGKHAYKFIVDDEWRFSSDLPTVADTHGNINNIVDLTHFEATLRNDTEPIDSRDYITDDSAFGDYIPGMDDYTKEPPGLPPHLRHIILNTAREGGEMDCPQHVTLDHLYCTALKKDGLMVLGITQRFRQKFVTTVYYSPEEPHIGIPLGDHLRAK